MKLDNGWLVNSVYSYTKDPSILYKVKLYKLERLIMLRLYNTDTLDTEVLENEIGKWVVDKLTVAKDNDKHINYNNLSLWVTNNALKHKIAFKASQELDKQLIDNYTDKEDKGNSTYWESNDIYRLLEDLQEYPNKYYRRVDSAKKAYDIISGSYVPSNREIERLEKAVREDNSAMTKEHEKLVDRQTVAMGMLDLISEREYDGLKEVWITVIKSDKWFNEVVAVPSLARDWTKQNVANVGMIDDLQLIVSGNVNEDY